MAAPFFGCGGATAAVWGLGMAAIDRALIPSYVREISDFSVQKWNFGNFLSETTPRISENGVTFNLGWRKIFEFPGNFCTKKSEKNRWFFCCQILGTLRRLCIFTPNLKIIPHPKFTMTSQVKKRCFNLGCVISWDATCQLGMMTSNLGWHCFYLGRRYFYSPWPKKIEFQLEIAFSTSTSALLDP